MWHLPLLFIWMVVHLFAYDGWCIYSIICLYILTLWYMSQISSVYSPYAIYIHA